MNNPQNQATVQDAVSGNYNVEWATTD